MCACSVAKLCPTLCTPWTHQAPLSMGFPRQESWSGLPFPSPGNLSDSRMRLESPAISPALQAGSLLLSHMEAKQITTRYKGRILSFTHNLFSLSLKTHFKKLLGGTVVRSLCFHCWGPGFNPWDSYKLPRFTQDAWCSQKKVEEKRPTLSSTFSRKPS